MIMILTDLNTAVSFLSLFSFDSSITDVAYQSSQRRRTDDFFISLTDS